jgi:hypothetical protein
MKDQQTICYTITHSIEALEKALKTHNLDVIALVHNLHRIREKAQRMEEGLKQRKKIMVREGLEEEYQLLKAKNKIPEGINKIRNDGEERIGKTEFEVIVKKEGEIIYQNTAHAGVVCVAEKVENINEEGQIDGTTQKLMFGNPMMIWFAFDQLKLAVEARGLEIMESIKQAVEAKKFVNPEVRKKIIEATNKIGGKR